MNLIGLILVIYHIFKDPHGRGMTIHIPDFVNLLYAIGLGYFNMSSIGVVSTKFARYIKFSLGKYGVVSDDVYPIGDVPLKKLTLPPFY